MPPFAEDIYTELSNGDVDILDKIAEPTPNPLARKQPVQAGKPEDSASPTAVPAIHGSRT